MQLLFFLTGEFDEEDVKVLRGVVSSLHSSHDWMITAPEFVDEEDDDEPDGLRTVGGVLQLPEVGPSQTERRGLEDLMHLIGALVRYSRNRRQELELEFELDGTFVGDIQGGEVGRTLRTGLIDPWCERVASS